MVSRKPEIEVRVAAEVESGSLPPPACVGCGSPEVELHKNWAICQRASRQFADVGERQSVVGLVGFIPFFLPLPSNDIVEIREGVDIVCPVPVRVCNRCWGELEGGARYRRCSNLAQTFFILAIALFMAWLFSRNHEWEIPYLWAAGAFLLALTLHMASSRIGAQRARRPF